MNMYGELVSGWYHLSTSSKILIIYYLVATIVEVSDPSVSVHVFNRVLVSRAYSVNKKRQLTQLPRQLLDFGDGDGDGA